jgi:hypothetical protein
LSETDETERPRPILSGQPPGGNGGKDHGTGSQPESAAAIRAPADADRSARPRSFAGAIVRLFRQAKKALTGEAPPAPQPKQRRRTEDTGRAAFQMAARRIMRRTIRLRAEAYAAATGYLWDTLDWINQWHSDPVPHYEPPSEDVDASPSNPLSLHL